MTFRGRTWTGCKRRPQAANLEAIALTLARLSQLVVDCAEVVGLDINPLLADETGVIALDARIEIDPQLAGTSGLNPALVVAPYPQDWQLRITISSGDEISIRPIRPADELLYEAFVKNTDPEDIRLRLFAPRKELSHRFAARLTQIDYAREMAFVAIYDAGDLCGIARLSADPNHEFAEFAIIVRSDLKRRGYGWALMQQLIDYATADGLHFLVGDILRENSAMLSLAKAVGFEMTTTPGDLSIMKAKMTLGHSANGKAAMLEHRKVPQ